MGKVVPRTIEIIKDTSQLEFVKMSGGQEVYNCPWCETKYGPNEKGFYPKLYIDPDKGVGICYRCNTVVIVGDRDDPKRKLRAMQEDTPDALEEVPMPTLEPIKDTYPRLVSRSPYLSELDLNSLALGEAAIGNRKVPVFPFLLDGRPFGYQLWLGRKDMKYYTYPAPKIPYSPTGIDTSRTYERITLVEGVFDALGAMWLKYPNPMAVLGYTLSNRELEIIESLKPKEVCVFLDETHLSLALAVQVADKLGVEVDVVNSDGEDPDERASRVYKTLKKRGLDNARVAIREKCR